MILVPIDIDNSKNARFAAHPDCVEILNIYPGYYNKVGYHLPWIGYFVVNDNSEIVGAGGYKGQPRDGKIEIAYSTFKKYEGKGVGTEICRQLVSLSLQTDPSVTITARTLPEFNASTTILTRNQFKCLGTVYDEEDGDVWEWKYQAVPLINPLA